MVYTGILQIVLIVLSFGIGGEETPMRQPRHGDVYVVAHRGAHRQIPENTIAAYRRAIELGVDFIEVDVRTTRDGEFVSVHNPTVDAYCTDGTTGRVRDFTLAELKTLDIGSRIGPQWADERIPTFAEILDLCRGGKCGIYLDLKAADVEPLIRLIRERGMARDVLWYASPGKLEDVRELCPECIPMPDPGPEIMLPGIIEVFKPRVIAAVWRHYSPGFVQTCHENGAIVIVDESDPTCWGDALSWGSDGIQTDHPAQLIEFIESRQKVDGRSE